MCRVTATAATCSTALVTVHQAALLGKARAVAAAAVRADLLLALQLEARAAPAAAAVAAVPAAAALPWRAAALCARTAQAFTAEPPRAASCCLRCTPNLSRDDSSASDMLNLQKAYARCRCLSRRHSLSSVASHIHMMCMKSVCRTLHGQLLVCQSVEKLKLI